jgi:heat shock protein HslJ
LISTKWILTGIRHTDTNIEELVPANLKFMNVVFNNSNKLHAISSCNVFDGDYLISGSNTIKIDNLCTTKMYCLNENTRLWESIYFDGFKSSDTFDFSGDTLTIIASSKIAMFFKAE